MSAQLLTTLGKGNYELACWRLGADDRTYQTHYAPIATAALIGDVAGVTVLLTDEARETHWRAFCEEIHALGVAVRAEPIPAGRSEAEIWEVFSAVDGVLRDADEVVLDVTHAFRSLPLVLFGSLTYLAALGDVRVRGVYYGAWDARTGHEAPLFDLGPLLALVQWSFGARAFQETGNPSWLAQLVRETRAMLFRRQGPAAALNRLDGALQNLGWAIPAGLPLEAGMHARTALEALGSVATDQPELAILRPLLDRLREALATIAIGFHVDRKSAIVLDVPELARQLRLARLYEQWGMHDRALLLLREWVISRSLLAAGQGQWLDYGRARRPMERALAALVERHRFAGGENASVRSPLPSLWSRTAIRRNQVAHAGMVPEMLGSPSDTVRQLLSECGALVEGDAAWSTERPGATRLLVTPLGLAPGVLFTALTSRAPDAALVITSREARPAIDEARTRAGWAGARNVFEVADAYACFGEVAAVVAWARPYLLEAREVEVNITGG
jgi:CRISPR-associated DxTHG motif protein